MGVYLGTNIDGFPQWVLFPTSLEETASGNVAVFQQGGVYDDAGNKSVSHRALDGTITFLPENSNLTWVPPVEADSTDGVRDCCYIDGPSARCFYLGAMDYSATRNDCYESGWGGATLYDRERTLSVTSSGTADSGRGEWKYSVTRKYHSTNLAVYTRTKSGTFEVWESGGYWYSNYHVTETTVYKYRDGTPDKVWSQEFSNSYRQNTVSVGMIGIRRADKAFSYLYFPTALDYDVQDAMFLALRDDAAWSNLVQSAISSAHAWDNNMLALIKDIIHLRVDVESMCSTAKDLARNTRVLVQTGEGLRSTTQSLASTYLGNKYGYGLTVSDCWTVGEAVRDIRKRAKSLKYGVQKLRSRYQSTITTNLGDYQASYAYMARVEKCDSTIMNLIRTSMSWDFYPTTANMWDFVPYSFVVDWLVDVGGLLETIDTSLEKAYLPVRSITKSVKMTSLQTEPNRFWGRGATGVVSISYYRRFPSFEWDPLLPILQPGSGLNGHFLESAALIIQRILGAKR